MTRKFFAVASACAFLGAAFAGTPSFGQGFPQGEEGHMRVPTGGIDLRSDSGADAVLNRIKYASTVFCEDTEGKMDIGRKLEARKCRDRMTYLAVSKLDAPLV